MKNENTDFEALKTNDLKNFFFMFFIFFFNFYFFEIFKKI